MNGATTHCQAHMQVLRKMTRITLHWGIHSNCCMRDNSPAGSMEYLSNRLVALLEKLAAGVWKYHKLLELRVDNHESWA